MRLTRARLAGGLAAASLALAACGGGSGAGAGDGIPEGAALLAADVPALVSLATDFEGEQWQTLEALLERFPAGAEAIEELVASLGEDGVDVETELKPALGSEVNVALLELPQEGDPPIALVTRPADPAKLEALLVEGDDPPLWRVVEDGWYVVADTEEQIDRALADGESLADDEQFAAAMEALPADALARIYLDGSALMEGLGQAAAEGADGSVPNVVPVFGAAGAIESLALALVAQDDGVRLEGVARSAEEIPVEAGPVELTEIAPADALAFASFHGLDEGLSQFLDLAGSETEDFDEAVGQLELALGVSLENDLLPIFAGEGALYVRAGAPIPEVTLLLAPEDAQRAVATLDKLVAGVAALEELTGSGEVEVADTTVAGVPAKQVRVSEAVSLLYAVVDGRLVVTTAVKGIADLVTGGDVLADAPAFQEAAAAAGLPEDPVAFVYVDLAGAVGVLDTVGALAEVDAKARENLAALSAALVHVAVDGSEARFAGFLGIE